MVKDDKDNDMYSMIVPSEISLVRCALTYDVAATVSHVSLFYNKTMMRMRAGIGVVFRTCRDRAVRRAPPPRKTSAIMVRIR